MTTETVETSCISWLEVSAGDAEQARTAHPEPPAALLFVTAEEAQQVRSRQSPAAPAVGVGATPAPQGPQNGSQPSPGSA